MTAIAQDAIRKANETARDAEESRYASQEDVLKPRVNERDWSQLSQHIYYLEGEVRRLKKEKEKSKRSGNWTEFSSSEGRAMLASIFMAVVGGSYALTRDDLDSVMAVMYQIQPGRILLVLGIYIAARSAVKIAQIIADAWVRKQDGVGK